MTPESTRDDGSRTPHRPRVNYRRWLLLLITLGGVTAIALVAQAIGAALAVGLAAVVAADQLTRTKPER
ncbi:hypothetical protein [Frankia tisae]|uniref:hypothetical protein n=1 Tax=Frankia tisae TaxID=2950104 RepID=UPI0021C0EACF|nr:hypothetical protein [Frankia tisae]